MKRHFSMSVITIILAVACGMCMTGCGQQQPAEEIGRDFHAEADAVYSLCVSGDDCYLCHGMQAYDGQNNVGIISLNTFRVMPIEINRYDHGELIRENTGNMQMRNYTDPDGGYSAYLTLDADRGITTATISFNDDQELNLENVAQHLCKDHLKEFTDSLYKNAYGVGIVNFEKKKLEAFRDELLGFQAGDFYVDCRMKGENEKTGSQEIRILVVYTPLRYGTET